MTILTVEAKPYDFQYDPAKLGILFIDFQRDFLYPRGFGESLGNDTSLLRQAVEPARKVLEASRAHSLSIFHIREGHQPDLNDCPPSKMRRGNFPTRIGDQGPMGRVLIRGEYGHGIIEEMAPQEGEVVIDKPGKSAFTNTNLHAELQRRGIKYLVFTGVTTEVCTLTTVAQGNDLGYEILTLKDCVASYKPDLHDAALRMITSQNGIFGWVSDSDKFLKSLLLLE